MDKIEKLRIYKLMWSDKMRITTTKDTNSRLKSWLLMKNINLPILEISLTSVIIYLLDLTQSDLMCNIDGCNNPKKFIGLQKRFINTHGFTQFCSKKCVNKNLSISQMGELNTVHRMTQETKNIMSEKLSIIMKDKIRKGEFTPCVTNSWAKSRCNIRFERNGEIINIKTRSTWEAFYQLVNTEQVYEKVVIPYEFNGVTKNYIVDFVDYDKRILYEIKPKTELNSKKVKAKEKYALKWCEDNRYEYIIISNDWFYDNYNKYEYLIDGQVDFDKMKRNLKQFKNENKKD